MTTSKYFYGNEISSYGIANGYVDYRTLAASFNHILNNNIMSFGEWELVSGSDYDEETEELAEIYQTYIVDERGAEILKEADEIVYYNEEMDLYAWGVTHWGTGWDYVLTKIAIDW